MKKLLQYTLSTVLTLLILTGIFTPHVFATIGIGWNATSTTAGVISPTALNGVNQAINVGTTTPSYIGNFATVLDASQFPGSDIGAKVNAAYAACPSIGCEITIPTGAWSFATPIVFGVSGKMVHLYCPVGGGFYLGTGTSLNYTASTGRAITFNTNNFVVGGSGIYNCNLYGPAGAGNPGSISTSTTGVYPGGSNGAFGFQLDNVHISGFGTGLEVGSNVSFLNVTNSVIDKNAKDIYSDQLSGANGENMRVTNSVIADGNNKLFGNSIANYCIDIRLSGDVQWTFDKVSFDDCQVYQDQFGGQNNVIKITNSHFENPNFANTGAYDYISTLSNQPGNVVVSIGNDYLQDDNVHVNPEFVLNGGNFVSIGDTLEALSYINTSMSYFVRNQDVSSVDTVYWSGLVNATANTGVSSIVSNVYNATHPVPVSPSGYGTGLNLSPSFNIAANTSTANGTTTIANLGGVLDASTFPGSDIGAEVNAAYAACPLQGCIIVIPRGNYFFSTQMVFNTNGKRVLLQGTPGEGTSLFYTGSSGAAITMDTGIQASGINHNTGSGIDSIFLHGNSYSTTSPEVGIKVGGVNGCDGCVFNGVNVYHFGYGYELSNVNTYHSLLSNSTIRDNGRNVYIQGPPTNAGEAHNFINDFIVDAANNYASECFYVDDYGASSVNITGGSIDDCGIYIGVQIPTFTMTGVHMENAGPSWGKYTYITVADSAYTNLAIVGGVFVQNNTTTKPDQFILSNGAGVSITGLTIFPTTGGTVTNLVVGGHAVWSGLNNTSGGVTNAAFVSPTAYPFTRSGSTSNDIVNFGLLGVATSSPSQALSVSGKVYTTGGVEFGDGTLQTSAAVHQYTFATTTDTVTLTSVTSFATSTALSIPAGVLTASSTISVKAYFKCGTSASNNCTFYVRDGTGKNFATFSAGPTGSTVTGGYICSADVLIQSSSNSASSQITTSSGSCGTSPVNAGTGGYNNLGSTNTSSINLANATSIEFVAQGNASVNATISGVSFVATP